MASKTRGPLDKQNRTPRFYRKAGHVLQQLSNGIDLRSSISSLNFKEVYKIRLHAMIKNIITHRAELDFVLSKTEIEKESYVEPNVLRVLVFEQLFRNKAIPCNSRTALIVIKNKRALETALAEYRSTLNSELHKPLLQMPRYVRVNTLKTTAEAVINHFINDGYQIVTYNATISYQDFISLVQGLKENEFLRDMHVDSLLVFHPELTLIEHPLYLEGKLIMQDKASCIPAIILKPRIKRVILDACAAPGMKTSHLAALFKNQGNILAIDVNAERVAEMKTLLAWFKVTCCTLKVVDFTSLNPSDMPYKKIRRILLDPSCSGSGMVKRNNSFNEDPRHMDLDRVRRLATFQLTMLRHALSFPCVKRVVYSTCSIHRMENEDVVSQALCEFGHRFRLVQPKRFLPFVNSDEDDETLRNKCLRFHPDRDLTNGFFIAFFKRIKDVILEISPGKDASINSLVQKRKRVEAEGEDLESADWIAKDCPSLDNVIAEETPLKKKKANKAILKKPKPSHALVDN